MKRNQIIIFCLFFLTSSICFGQKTINAVLISEFSKSNCEVTLERTDFLFYELSNATDSKGYIVIYGNENNQLEKYITETAFRDAITFHNFDMNRIAFIHGKDNKETKIQFWLVSNSANKPNFIEQEWDYSLSKINKPFIFYQQSWTDYGLCPSFNSEDLYFKLLNANSNLRGHIVIRSKSKKNYLSLKQGIETNFIKIEVTQLKRYLIKIKNESCKMHCRGLH